MKIENPGGLGFTLEKVLKSFYRRKPDYTKKIGKIGLLLSLWKQSGYWRNVSQIFFIIQERLPTWSSESGQIITYVLMLNANVSVVADLKGMYFLLLTRKLLEEILH